MVALNFMKQFAADVESGKKLQTIREKTKARTSCDLHLYYGQRTKQCRKLGNATCTSVQRIVIMQSGVQIVGSTFIAGHRADEFAQADGFNTYADMWAFFKDRANEDGEFASYLIKWGPVWVTKTDSATR